MNWNQAEQSVTSTLVDHENRIKKNEGDLNAIKIDIATALAQKNMATAVIVGVLTIVAQIAIAWFFKK